MEFPRGREYIIKEHHVSRWLKGCMLQSPSNVMNSEGNENKFNLNTHSRPN